MYSIVLLFICSYVFTNADVPDIPEHIEKIKDKCVAQLHLKTDKHANIPNIKEGVALNHDEKCLLKCMFKQLGHLKDDGKIDEQSLMFMIPVGATANFDSCNEKVAGDSCEDVYELFKCATDILTKLQRAL